MSDQDPRPEEFAGPIIPLPLCDDEDELIGYAEEPAQLEPSDDGVEGHGGWDFESTE